MKDKPKFKIGDEVYSLIKISENRVLVTRATVEGIVYAIENGNAEVVSYKIRDNKTNRTFSHKSIFDTFEEAIAAL